MLTNNLDRKYRGNFGGKNNVFSFKTGKLLHIA